MLTEVIDGVYIGDRQDATDLDRIEGDPHVVTLVSPEIDTTTEYHPLVDGKNKQEDFDNAVETVVSLLGSDRPLVVHCRMGQSRSPVVVATALAEQRDEPYHSAIERVRETGRVINPDRDLITHAHDYLDESPWYD